MLPNKLTFKINEIYMYSYTYFSYAVVKFIIINFFHINNIFISMSPYTNEQTGNFITCLYSTKAHGSKYMIFLS